MATTARPISTISYNTEDFLIERLESLVKGHKISEYRFIRHVGEDGDKDHIHLQMFPCSNRLDVVSLREYFNEVDPSGDPRPLGVLRIQKSTVDDWILYALHDPVYLSEHSDVDDLGKREYSVDEIIGNIPEQIQRDYRHALMTARRGVKAEIMRSIMQGAMVQQLMVKYPDHVGYIYQAFRLGQIRGLSLSGEDIEYFKHAPESMHLLSDKLAEETFGGDSK